MQESQEPVIVYELPVLREDYCSQRVADDAIRYVLTNGPDLVQALVLEVRSRGHDHWETAWKILEYLEEQHVEIPETSLGKVDLIFEFSRRLCRAYGYPEPVVCGHPLGPGPDEPLPPLIQMDVSEYIRKNPQVTQEKVDRVLEITYQTRPRLWFEFGEEIRHNMLLYAWGQFPSHIQQITVAQCPEFHPVFDSMIIRFEAERRICMMCGLDDLMKP